MTTKPSHNQLQSEKLRYMSPSTSLINTKSSAIPTPTARIPTGQRSISQSSDLPMQSPRTPNLSHMVDFPDFHNVTEENTESALKAIDLYANTIMSKNLDSPPDFFNMSPMTGHRTYNYNEDYDHSIYTYDQTESTVHTPTSITNSTPVNSSTRPTTMVTNNSLPGYTSNRLYMPGDKRTQGGGDPKSGKVHSRKNLPMKALRKYHLSLDPVERETLEKLVEEVILDGCGVGVIDSDSASTDESTDESSYPADMSEVCEIHVAIY